MANLQVYAGDGFEVTYDPGTCIHAAECARGLPEVFDPQARPWVRPERAPAERIAAVVARCPSGALRFVGRAEATQKASRTTVTLRPDGPLLLSGDVEVLGPDGTVLFAGPKTALCRCGHSARKPFCDGSHKAAGFRG
ncbi:MAG TPA: (4Fe-4S)-binding protein [Anaeromyxobacter sp.]|nr:(4Fe-4S)-binding protein [Anaeromyxobacter sp.]